ncbi:MAG TPA: trigger factor [Pyrinomonadaceae bacterium]|jgi:trigger factor|nr:trigger factor [Pyrinomonadaceae bacterium]
MKTEVADVSSTRKEITIEIDTATVRQTYDRISDRYAKQAKVPGFRPGHAPRAVVRTRFKSEIRAQALQELVPGAVDEAIKEHAPTAIGEPDVQLDNSEALEKFGEEPISVKINVEILPKVELQNYKGIEIVRQTRPVTDENVAEMIEALRETSAALTPVEDRGAAVGDNVTINIEGKFVEDPEAENIKQDDVEVTLGGKGVQQEFTDNLTGVKADDERTFLVDYPADYRTEALAGKKVEYSAKVTAVRVKELPDVDDEWAHSLGEDFDSVTTLKAKIRENMERQATEEADHRLRAELMQKLLEGHQFEVPQSLVDQQTSYRLETVVRDMIGRGVDPRNQNVNWEGAREELKVQAELDVRGSLLLDQVALDEQIEVSNEEIEAEIETIARSSQQPIEQVRSVLTKDGGERSIANRLRNRKALDLLVENAKVTEAEWSEKSEETEVRSQSSE